MSQSLASFIGRHHEGLSPIGPGSVNVFNPRLHSTGKILALEAMPRNLREALDAVRIRCGGTGISLSRVFETRKGPDEDSGVTHIPSYALTYPDVAGIIDAALRQSLFSVGTCEGTLVLDDSSVSCQRDFDPTPYAQALRITGVIDSSGSQEEIERATSAVLGATLAHFAANQSKLDGRVHVSNLARIEQANNGSVVFQCNFPLTDHRLVCQMSFTPFSV